MRDEIKLTKAEKEKVSKAATDFSLLCQGDQITRHMLVSNGFAVVPPAERVVFEDEDSTDTES